MRTLLGVAQEERPLSTEAGPASGIAGRKYLVGRTSDLADGQMKEVTIEVEGEEKPQKVLLSRIKGQFFATSHLCTHYKARLVTGVLSADGRVTW